MVLRQAASLVNLCVLHHVMYIGVFFLSNCSWDLVRYVTAANDWQRQNLLATQSVSLEHPDVLSKVKGGDFGLQVPSGGGTEQAMQAACCFLFL